MFSYSQVYKYMCGLISPEKHGSSPPITNHAIIPPSLPMILLSHLDAECMASEEVRDGLETRGRCISHARCHHASCLPFFVPPFFATETLFPKPIHPFLFLNLPLIFQQLKPSTSPPHKILKPLALRWRGGQANLKRHLILSL